MRRLLVSFGIAAATVAGCVHTPTAWSPDGRWLAYTVATREVDRVLAPGWIFGGGEAARPEADDRITYRLWATRPDTGASTLLETSAGPLTSAGWSPDGKALAFGRVIPGAGGRSRFEVVIQEAPDRRRVLRGEDVPDPAPEAAGLPALAIAWSPDGRLLAAPQFRPRGLVVLRVDDGRTLKVIEEAYLPSWAPRGGKLAFYRGGGPEGLYCLDSRLGEPHLLTEISQPLLAPAWSPDGRTIWALRRRPAGPLELLKVGAEGEGAEPDRTLVDFDAPEQSLVSASFTFDPTGLDLYFSTQVEGQPSLITHQRPRDRAVLTRENPIDMVVPIGGLSASPAGKWLALRAGPPGITAPAGLFDLEAQRFIPLAPDDATRAQWLGTLVGAARTVLRDLYPDPIVGDRPVERPTLLPAPGEVPRGVDGPARLRRLADLGRPLCDRPAGSPPPGPALAALLAEARLFFDALREDYGAALEDLDEFERGSRDADQRSRILALRAQLYLARGDVERARAALAYLRPARPGSAGRLEMTPAGPVLTADPDRQAGWLAYLAERVEARATGSELPARPGSPPVVDGLIPPLIPGRAVRIRRPPPRLRRPPAGMLKALVPPAPPPPADAGKADFVDP